MAGLDADGIAVCLVGAPADLLLRNKLDNLTGQPDDIMTAGLCGVGDAQILKIISVGLCAGAGVANVNLHSTMVSINLDTVILPSCSCLYLHSTMVSINLPAQL